MKYPKFAYIPQQVFPNQRKDERVYILARRHWVSFIFFGILLVALFIIPFLSLILLFGQLREIAAGNNLLQDIIILGFGVYYLVLEAVLLTSWISYYYNIFIVTNERVIDIAQKGLFNRETHELFFEQIEDVSSKTKGIAYTLLNVGDIELETAGPALNFVISKVNSPQAVVEILHDLSFQAKQGVRVPNRIPNLPVMGIIDDRKIPLNGDTPPIMNLNGELKGLHHTIKILCKKPKTLRQKIDYWWNMHCSRMVDSLEQSEEEGEESPSVISKAPIEKSPDEEKPQPAKSRTVAPDATGTGIKQREGGESSKDEDREMLDF